MATLAPNEAYSLLNPYVPPKDTSGGGTGGGGTGGGGSRNLMDVRTEDQIRADVTRQIEEQISAAESPLNAQIGTLGSDRDAAIAGIDKMFGNILPYVQNSAKEVQSNYVQAEGAQQQIYSAANSRLNELKQSQAAEAQALSQKMGGPVAIDGFTDGVNPAASAYAVEGGGQMLHTLAYGQADAGAAQAFAGRVFPLVQTEQTAQARQHYETQIKEIRAQIADLEASKSSKINSGVADAMIAERTYALQKAQQELDKVKAAHDWTATQKSLANEQARLKLAQSQFKQDTKTTKANLTIERQKLSQADKQFADQMGLSYAELKVRKAELAKAGVSARKAGNLAARQAAASYLDAAVNPKPGKTVTYSQVVPVPKDAALLGKVPNAYADANSPTGYSQLITVHQASVTTPITEPNALVSYLMAHLVPRKMAINMVRNRLQLPDTWQFTGKVKKQKAPPVDRPNRPGAN